MNIIGCDPGVTGALAFLSSGNLVEVVDMPTRVKRVNGSDRDIIDEDGVHELLQKWRLTGARRFIIERVSGLPGQSAPRAFTFGYGFGVVLSTARLLNFETEVVTSQEWKGKLVRTTRESRLKQASVNAATQVFGNDNWKLKKDHGRAEAALIALFGHRYVWNGGE